VLKDSEFWSIDGTFNYSPHQFLQQVEIMTFNAYTKQFEISVVGLKEIMEENWLRNEFL